MNIKKEDVDALKNAIQRAVTDFENQTGFLVKGDSIIVNRDTFNPDSSCRLNIRNISFQIHA